MVPTGFTEPAFTWPGDTAKRFASGNESSSPAGALTKPGNTGDDMPKSDSGALSPSSGNNEKGFFAKLVTRKTPLVRNQALATSRGIAPFTSEYFYPLHKPLRLKVKSHHCALEPM